MLIALCLVGNRRMSVDPPFSKMSWLCLQSTMAPTLSSQLMGNKGGVWWSAPSCKTVKWSAPLVLATPIGTWAVPFTFAAPPIPPAPGRGPCCCQSTRSPFWANSFSKRSIARCPITASSAAVSTKASKGWHWTAWKIISLYGTDSSSNRAGWEANMKTCGPVEVIKNCLRGPTVDEPPFCLLSCFKGQSLEMWPNSSQLKHLVLEIKSSSYDFTTLEPLLNLPFPLPTR